MTAHPVAEPQVLYHHILQERGLAGAGLPDNVHMMAAVFGPDAE